MSKIYEVVAVYDNLTEAYLEPRFFATMAEAQRIFEYQINNIDLWRENASDYDLYSLGTYDAESGTLKSDVHKMIKGTAVLRKEKRSDIRSAEQTEEN